MPDAIITSTESTFGTISGTFAADQSTITGTVTGIVAGTLSGSVGVPGPQGQQGPQGIQGPPGPPGEGGTWGSIVGTLSAQTDLWAKLGSKLDAPTVAATDGQIPAWNAATSLPVWIDNSARSLFLLGVNKTGSTIPKGAAVYVSGGTGGTPEISLAQANAESTSARTIGVTTDAIANNAQGNVVVGGAAQKLDTSAYSEGQILYLSPTVAGGFVTSLPTQPYHGVVIGYVTRSNISNGVIEVAIQNYQELSELSDVLIASKAEGDLLSWDATAGIWKNRTVSGLGLATQAWVDAQGYLQAGALTGYALESWVTSGFYPLTGNPSGFLTSASLSGYLTKADNLASVASVSTARDNLGLGSLSTPTFAGVTVQGSGSNVANLTPTSLSLTHTTYGSFVIQPSVGIKFPDASVQTTAFPAGADVPTGGTTGQALVKVSNSNYDVDWATISASATWGSITGTLSSQTDLQTALDGKYSTSNPSGYITSSALTGYATESWVTSQGYITSAALSPYLTSATAASTYQTIAGMSSYLTTSSAASTYYPLTNPSGYITSSALSPYLTSATAASTYQTLSGMSSYLTTATAASTYATILEPSVDGILTVEPSGSNSATVQVNQDANNYIHIRPGVGQIAMVYGGSTKWFFNDTYLQFPGGTQQTVAYPGPSGFLLKADNLSGLANTATARTNLGLGTMAVETASNYLTTSAAASTYLTQSSAASTYYLQTNPAGYITSSALSPYLTSATAASTYAPLASPALTGNPTAPTPATADNDTSIATTAFVKAQGYLTSAPVTSVAGKTGAVTLVVGDVSGAAPLASPTFTGTPAAPTAAVDTNTTQVATTAYVVGQGYLKSATASSTYAPLASPSLTGTPTAPTATLGTNTTQIATTAFVQSAVSAGSGAVWGSITGTLSSQTDLQSALDAKLSTASAASTYAPLASPTFTGTVTIPSGASISGYATTASLASYAPLASPALTGTPTAPTATAGTSTTQIATTAFVRADNNVKAWVNFNGTGTVAIRASMNVSSITDNGAGDYTVNFTSAISDANYSTIVTCMRVSGNTGAESFLRETTTPTTSLVRIGTTNQGGTSVDPTYVNVAIIR